MLLVLLFCCFSVAFPVDRGGLSFFFLFELDGREIELVSGSTSFALSPELLLGEGLPKSSQESTLEELEPSEDSSPLSAIFGVFSSGDENLVCACDWSPSFIFRGTFKLKIDRSVKTP